MLRLDIVCASGSISVLLALTVYSAALQARVGLIAVEESIERVNVIWPRFQHYLQKILRNVQSKAALVDATGFPLLPPREVHDIWHAWMLYAFVPSKGLQDSAEHLLNRAERAFWATEDFYFSRLRPRLLEGCGAVCDNSLQKKVPSTFWLPEYSADIATWHILASNMQ